MDTEERKEKTKEDICGYLKEGMYKGDSARLAGVSEDTYRRWYEEDADFAGRVEANILEYKRSLIKIVNACAEKDGRLAFEVLRRRWSEDWREYEGKRIITGLKVQIVKDVEELEVLKSLSAQSTTV